VYNVSRCGITVAYKNYIAYVLCVGFILFLVVHLHALEGSRQLTHMHVLCSVDPRQNILTFSKMPFLRHIMPLRERGVHLGARVTDLIVNQGKATIDGANNPSFSTLSAGSTTLSGALDMCGNNIDDVETVDANGRYDTSNFQCAAPNTDKYFVSPIVNYVTKEDEECIVKIRGNKSDVRGYCVQSFEKEIRQWHLCLLVC